MKTKTASFSFFAAFALICVFQLTGCQSPKKTAPIEGVVPIERTAPIIQESWQTISNRWGSFPLEKIKRAAETNEVTAQYFLAIAYSNGSGIATNQTEAFKWMNLAAQQGMAMAQRKLGWMFWNGRGVATNMDEAVVWYQKAAEQGDATAQFSLGQMYDRGINVSQDYTEAANFYRLAAEQGHAMAQNNLGWLYKKGWGVPDDQAEAVKWFKKSAEQGEKLAAENLAWTYAAGVYGATNTFGQGAEAQVKSGGIAPNHELAEKWMRKAVDLNSAEGQFQFAELLHGEFNNEGTEETSRFAEAAQWYRKAAEQGHAQAQYELADMFNTGQMGNDQRSNCIPWFLKAAAQGNAEAQAEVGRLHEYYPNSELLKSINPIDSLKQSAAQGNLSAQFDLARRYHVGDGVPKDAVEAFTWMEKAAQHEVSPITRTIDAHYYLGVMYETGEGVTKDLSNACQLYLEAAVGGNKPDPFVRVGQMFEEGEGVPQNDRLAAENYYSALQFGFSPTSDDTARCTAIENLLKLYFQGRGFPDDTNMVSQQLNEIKRNHPITTAKGQFLFGEIYYQSQVVPQDIVEAAAWFCLAANQNLEDARKKLEQVELKMSSTEKEAEKTRVDSLGKRAEEAKASYKQMENYRRSHAW